MSKAPRSLPVWLDGEQIATLERRRWNDLRLRYSSVALERWPMNSPIVSCSLPLVEGAQRARAFCSGLLPEGQALEALAARAGVSTNDTFELLERYGRDIAGALTFGVPLGAPEDGPRVEPYSEDGLARAVGELAQHPLGVGDDSELSIAGLQDKLLLVALPGGGWGRPIHGQPSTHILKVEDRRFPGMAEAEAQALRLAEAVGLTAVDPQVVEVDGIPCLIVRRFDRRGTGDAVARIHQEDLCQAMGVSPVGADGRGKYESAGGPSLRDLARLLDIYARDPLAELDRLVEAVAFTAAIGNADAHAKNLALLHPRPGEVQLAPLYDTVPTVLWPRLRTQLAMRIGAADEVHGVTLDDIVAEGVAWRHPEGRTRDIATRLLERLMEASASAVAGGDPRLAALVSERCHALMGA